MAGRLEGKIALVTGASQGMGRVAAIAFAKEGAKVVLAARNEEKLTETADEIRTKGGEAMVVATDVTKEEDCKKMVDEALEAFGGLHIAFNNHGVSGGDPTGFANCDEVDVTKTFDVNLKSLVFCFKYQIFAMAKTGDKGSIIVNSSAAGQRTSTMEAGNHLGLLAASKAGADMLMRYAAIEGAPSGVRVNSVAPGVTMTPVLRDLPEDVRDNMINNAHLIKRAILPEQIANLVVFLASDDAAMVTGSVYKMDGGWTLKA